MTSAAQIDEMRGRLATRSPELAAAFDTVMVTIAAKPGIDESDGYARMALRISRDSWKSLQLACRYFELTGPLLDEGDVGSVLALGAIADRVQDQSPELAETCLAESVAVLRFLDGAQRSLCLEMAGFIEIRNLLSYIEIAAVATKTLSASGMESLVLSLLPVRRSNAFELLLALLEGIDGTDAEMRPVVRKLALSIREQSSEAAAAFLTALPELLSRLDASSLARFVAAGLGQNVTASQLHGYFSLSGQGARAELVRLAGGVALDEVSSLLAGFARALCGRTIDLGLSGTTLGRRLSTDRTRVGALNGSIVFLPEYMASFASRNDNFDAYKVSVAHQAGRIEFGSFGLRYGEDGAYLPWSLESDRGADDETLVPVQRYLDLFPQRETAHALFTLVEDYRIHSCTRREYPGLRPALERVARAEAGSRAKPGPATVRGLLVENLVLVSLGQMRELSWPEPLVEALASAAAVLRLVTRRNATVQDSAAAAAWLYELVMRLPQRRIFPADLVPLCIDPELIADVLPPQPPMPNEWLEGNDGPPDELIPVGYRGTFTPEIIQAAEVLADLPVITDEQHRLLEEMLANSVETEAEIVAEDVLDSLEVLRGERPGPAGARETAAVPPEDGAVFHYYDEWDFRRNDYMADWCRVAERPGRRGGPNFCLQILAEHQHLVQEIRRQFEMMRPASHRRIRNLDDGPEFDLEQAIQFRVDRKAGAGPRARVYSRREKVERSVAVALLVDVSGSTSESVAKRDIVAMADVTNSRDLVPERIIDVERQAIVFLVEALEAVGDDYGIYCFSGYGRANVDFHIVKDIGVPLDEAVYKRIDGMDASRGTRMGAAIRHGISKLRRSPARVRLLLVLSDGRPEDRDYGMDGNDREYGLRDTRQALLECRRAGITPFMVTVDHEGEDYLGPLCPDMGYEIVDRVEQLPSRLPGVYRYLTGN